MPGPTKVIAGSTDVSVVIRIMDSTDGTPETGVTSATGGLALEYRREGATSTAITESNLTALTDAHSDGGMLHIGNGEYRVDIPDAAFAAGADKVTVHGTATGMVVYGPTIELTDPVNGLFRSFPISSAGNTTTNLRVDDFAGYADDEFNDELWWVYDVSADEWHPVWVTDFSTTNGDATVETAQGGGALPFTPEASTDRVWRSGLNRNNLLNTAALNAINAEADTAISDASLATAAALATVDGNVDSILDDTGTSGVVVAGTPDVNVTQVSGSSVAADRLEEFAEAIIVGAAQTGTLTVTSATTDLTGYADDELIGRTIIFKSGTADGQSGRITDYASASGQVTYSEITTAPANGDLFIIL